MINMTDTLELEDAHTSGAHSKRPAALVRGAGSTVWDEDGNAYLDLAGGHGVVLLGHNHPAVSAAIREQAGTLVTCPEIFYNDRRAELYALLASVTPGDIERFFLCNSGAEAVEGALKVAQLLTGRQGIVAAKRAFHGRTHGALALTWDRKYRQPFAAWLGETVQHVPYNDLDALAAVINEDTAAVVLEPVQGEGGVHPAEGNYLRGARDLCDRHGALLIVDEIQTGFGRTGCWFACEEAGIVPDIITLGKGIAGGVPMGAVGWHGDLGQIPTGSHGSTFGGNPLAAAAAIATITTLRDEDLSGRAAEVGGWFLDELRALDLRAIREIRGRGLMIGIELRGRVTPVLKALHERGIIALPAGTTVLRLLPPLTISRDDLRRVLTALEEVLS